MNTKDNKTPERSDAPTQNPETPFQWSRLSAKVGLGLLAALVAVSFAGLGEDVHLQECLTQDCGGDGGSADGNNDLDVPIYLNVTTSEDSATVKFWTNLSSDDYRTEVTFDPDETDIDVVDTTTGTVEYLTEFKPEDLTKVKVYQNGELEVALDAGLDQSHHYEGMTIQIQNGTKATECDAITRWQTHYGDIHPVEDPSNEEKNVSVFVKWNWTDTDGTDQPGGEKGPNTTHGNPAMVNGTHVWEDKLNLDHYNLNYRVEVNQTTIFESGWFEAGPSPESAECS